MDESYMGVTEFSKLIGVTIQTLRNWDASGKLKPHHRTAGGQRVYSRSQAELYLSGKMFQDGTDSS